MITIKPSDMQETANELNYLFFVCDESLRGWSNLSTPFLRLLKTSAQDSEKDPEFWMKLVEMPSDELSEKLELLSANRENIQFSLPFFKNENEKIKVIIRISSVPEVRNGRVYRLGSAEVENEDSVYKQEALQSRDNVIEISARIQRILLAGNIEQDARDLEIAAETIPSRDVDGDFYEFLQPLPGISDFIIGDVMGKGVPAALLAAAIKSAYFKSLITSGIDGNRAADIGSVLKIMDSLIGSNLIELKKFLTLYYCRINMEKFLLSFIDAGHTWFIYYDSDSDSCWNVKGSNMPIGFSSDQIFRTFLLPFGNEDLLFFYSDGISEARNSEGEFFGHERIRQLVNAHSFLKPAELLKKVLNVIFYFSAGVFDDDVTGVVIKSAGRKNRPGIVRSYNISREHRSGFDEIREQFSEDLSEIYSAGSEDDCSRLIIAMIEACTNCILYGSSEVKLEWKIFSFRTEIGITYSGPDYAWFTAKVPATEEYQQNGYGQYLIEQGTDSSLLMYGKDERKKLVMIKEFV